MRYSASGTLAQSVSEASPRERGSTAVLSDRCALAGASPRERGSTCSDMGLVVGSSGFPARAGVHPSLTPVTSRLARLPRASGGPPGGVRLRLVPVEASPRERGSTLLGARRPLLDRGFPARAGVHPQETSPSRSSSRLPRASGGPPSGAGIAPTAGAASPRERGSTLDRARQHHGDLGFPARAGVHLVTSTLGRPLSRLPRASGGPPYSVSATLINSKASPRERGSTPLGVGADEVERGFPARAGVHPQRLAASAPP